MVFILFSLKSKTFIYCRLIMMYYETDIIHFIYQQVIRPWYIEPFS